MDYLNEDAVNHQIQQCKKTSDKKGVKCPQCQQIKLKLCPLGESWVNKER